MKEQFGVAYVMWEAIAIENELSVKKSVFGTKDGMTLPDVYEELKVSLVLRSVCVFK